MASIGNLVAKLSLDSNQFSAGTNRAGQDLAKLDSRFDSFGTRASASMAKVKTAALGMAAAIGAAAVAAAIKLARDVGREIDEIGNLYDEASKLGIGTDVLAGLRYGAEQSGVAIDTLDQSMSRFLRSVSAGSKAFAELGLSGSALRGMSVEGALGAVADRLSAMDSAADKIRIATEIFGRSGEDMVNYLAEGSAGMRRLAAEAEALGLTIDHDVAAKVESAGDAVARIDTAWQGVKTTLAVGVAPAVERVANRIAWSVAEMNKLTKFSGVGLDLATSAFHTLRGDQAGAINALAPTALDLMKAGAPSRIIGGDGAGEAGNDIFAAAMAAAQARLRASERALQEAMRASRIGTMRRDLGGIPAVEKGTVEAARVMAEVRRGENDRMLEIARQQLRGIDRTAQATEDLAKRDEVTVVEEGI